MMNRFVVSGLRALLAAALLVILLVQVVALPWFSGEVAKELPAEAHMRWPILGLSVAGLFCVQLALFSIFRLLGMVKVGEVFSERALFWVNIIIGAALGGSLVCVATFIYQSFAAVGPPLWMLMLLAGTLFGIGIALLMTVMRTLLVQATTLRLDMEEVI